tara:strand:- start:964 stop:1881 length:918 start_codon:yes stop_codon:yes gene_type:complete
MNRRNAVTSLLTLSGSAALASNDVIKKKEDKFKFSLNMSTIRGHKLGFRKELEIASKAGYQSVEIWVNTFQDYLKEGHTLAESKRLIDDLGLTIEDAIGFAPWIVDEKSVREKGLEQLKLEMDQLAGIGCKRIAAPPAGATTGAFLDLKSIAERYRATLMLGEQAGVVPQLELWGFSKNLSRVGELLYVATEADHADARVLMDVYHLHKGGSGMDSVANVGKSLIEVFHINDYPKTPPRESIVDADRVYAGDGVAPLPKLLKTLENSEKPIILSFEVFNPAYYKQDALLVAKTGLEKMKKVVSLI